MEPDVRMVVQNDALTSHVASAWKVYLSGLFARISRHLGVRAGNVGIPTARRAAVSARGQELSVVGQARCTARRGQFQTF